jgi:hypothetical protein
MEQRAKSMERTPNSKKTEPEARSQQIEATSLFFYFN